MVIILLFNDANQRRKLKAETEKIGPMNLLVQNA